MFSGTLWNNCTIDHKISLRFILVSGKDCFNTYGTLKIGTDCKTFFVESDLCMTNSPLLDHDFSLSTDWSSSSDRCPSHSVN